MLEQRRRRADDLRLGLRVSRGVRALEDGAGVDLRHRLGDPVDGLAGALLGLTGALLGVGDPVEHLAQAPGALDLLRLGVGELLGALRPGLSFGGAILDLLEPLRRATQRVVGAPLILGEALLGVDQLAGELLLFGAVALQLVLGPGQLGEQRLAPRLVRRSAAASSVAAAARQASGSRLGVAAALGLGQPRERLALGRLADRELVGAAEASAAAVASGSGWRLRGWPRRLGGRWRR